MDRKRRYTHQVVLRLTPSLYAATQQDRDTHRFTERVNRILGAYYLPEAEASAISERKSRLLADVAACDAELQAISERAAQAKEERNEEWAFVRAVKLRIANSGAGARAITRRQWEAWLSGRAKVPSDAWAVIAKETGVDWANAEASA